MHITLSWDISAEGARWTEIDSQLKAIIKPYSWVRPLKTVYVVKVASTEERARLVERFAEVARGCTEIVHILVTPAMSGGQYNGFLPKDLWSQLNERTT
jgi:hypothetical protein